MTRAKKRPAHGGKRKGAGRPPSSDLTARLVVRVEPVDLERATAALGGGPRLAQAMRVYLRYLAGGGRPKGMRSPVTAGVTDQSIAGRKPAEPANGKSE